MTTRKIVLTLHYTTITPQEVKSLVVRGLQVAETIFEKKKSRSFIHNRSLTGELRIKSIAYVC